MSIPHYIVSLECSGTEKQIVEIPCENRRQAEVTFEGLIGQTHLAVLKMEVQEVGEIVVRSLRTQLVEPIDAAA